jgi:hypothetical protein
MQTENEEINFAVARLRQKGASETQIDTFLEAEYNLVLVSGQTSPAKPGPMAAAHLTIPAPKIYRNDNSVPPKWVAMATWRWNNLRDSIGAETGFCVHRSCAVGEEDGFGLAFNRHVADPGIYSMLTWGMTDYYPPSTSRGHVSDANSDGVSFIGQDSVKKGCTSCVDDYSFANGQLMYTIDNVGCGPLTAFSKFGHTWSSVRVDSIGIAPNQVNINFSTGSEKFPKASPASNTIKLC